jgi:23S rRNA pseudouridine2605 synthase
MTRKEKPKKRKKSPKHSRVGSEPVAIAEPIRLNRYIALSGICSRRKADVLIEEGRVSVDGVTTNVLGTWVKPGNAVRVNGRLISPRPFSYLLLNKPKDTLTTTKDEQGRQTVMDLIRSSGVDSATVFPVGRLDRDTLGVLLFTNDGDLSHRLMHPRYEIEKVYLVETRDSVKPHEIDQLKQGIILSDGPASADQVTYVSPPNTRQIALQIHEGRNRQVRRMIKALGHDVVHLERIRYAGLTADGVRRGHWRFLKAFEVERLHRMVKLR